MEPAAWNIRSHCPHDESAFSANGFVVLNFFPPGRLVLRTRKSMARCLEALFDFPALRNGSQ